MAARKASGKSGRPGQSSKARQSKPASKVTPSLAWQRLGNRVKRCRKCPRLIEHCQAVARKKRKAYADQKYWGRPVPDFGPENFQTVSLLIVGLAPGAHGANRTGRMFTGDNSGLWLYRAMHRAGFANQADSTDRSDGLRLIDCAVTNVCRCAPPGNKPAKEEIANCQPFFESTIELCQPRIFLALGGLAWRATLDFAIRQNWVSNPRPKPKFKHAAQVPLRDDRLLLGCYHVSQQNTFTGRLTETMLDEVFDTIVAKID